jgi:hypothetical protein
MWDKVRCYWEHVGEQQKSEKHNTLPPSPKEKTLGPLNACGLTSLVAKNFYAYVL